MNIPDTLAKGAIGAACTALVSVGAAVIDASRDNSVQDHEIVEIKNQQEASAETLKKLDESVRSLDKNVAVLNERLEQIR